MTSETKVDVLAVMWGDATDARMYRRHFMRHAEEADRFDRSQSAREAVAELIEAVKPAVATIKDYLAYEHDGDPWTEDARAMGEMDINDFATDGRLERLVSALSRIAGEA